MNLFTRISTTFVAQGFSERLRPQEQARESTSAGLPRTGGTLALIAALAHFLLIGIRVENDLQRFALLLLQTGLMTGCAFALQRWFDDTKSARLVLGVSLVSVVAGFAVLGAMLYATFPLDSSGVQQGLDAAPAFTRWRPGSAIQTALAAIAAALVLAPTARFGFMVLARASAARLTALTLLASTTPLLLGAGWIERRRRNEREVMGGADRCADVQILEQGENSQP